MARRNEEFDALIRLSDEYYAGGKFEKAIKECTFVIDIVPENKRLLTLAYAGRGAAKNRIGDYYGAATDFTEAIKCSPAYKSDDKPAQEKLLIRLYGERSLANSEIGRLEEAIEDFDGLIRLRPMDILARYKRILVKNRLRRREEAIAEYDEVVRFGPEDKSVRHKRSKTKRQGSDDAASKDGDISVGAFLWLCLLVITVFIIYLLT